MKHSRKRSRTEDTKHEEEVIYRRVPWINWDEWNFVRDALFSSSPDAVDKALERVATWRSRGSLPILVDVTAAIIQTHQKDPNFRKDLQKDTLLSETMMADLYSSAILRLVNGVVDQDRNKRGKIDKRVLSINEAANEIGLPRMLIDIRHEFSHRDRPSLQLLREGSVKALKWIKSYYWEPQKNAVPHQRDRTDFVKKKIKSKLHELAFQLNMKQDSQIKSPSMKRKRVKNQITRILERLFRLYSSYPLEFVASLLHVLKKALDSAASNSIEAPKESGPDPLSENSETPTGVIDLCKYLITHLSRKEPELLLIMLRAVLETLETSDTMNAEHGRGSLSFSQSKAEMHQVEKLSPLVLWLIKRYNKLRHPSEKIRGDDIHNSAAETIAPKVALEELLRKCLLVLSPGNTELAKSALLLTEITGNNIMAERVKKLPAIRLPNLDYADESLTHKSSEHVSINDAEKLLELLKSRRNKNKPASAVASNGDVRTNDGRWTVAKSWNPCPIGMLPGSLGTTGVLPILDRVINVPDDQVASEGMNQELNNCAGSICASIDTEALEKIDNIEDGMAFEEADDQDLLLDPFKGQLMIGGIYRKVHPEELHAIESAVRILV